MYLRLLRGGAPRGERGEPFPDLPRSCQPQQTDLFPIVSGADDLNPLAAFSVEDTGDFQCRFQAVIARDPLG